MTRERLRVTWKIIRRAGQGRNVNTYCSYIAENEMRKHKLKTVEGTKLFSLLESTMICSRNTVGIYLDGIYRNGNLVLVSNFRKM